MSTHTNPTMPSSDTAFPTVAQLIARISAADALSPQRRRDVASALRCLAKAVRMPPESLIAEPAALRIKLKDFTPAMAGLTPGRWRNIWSLTGFALMQAGLCVVPDRATHPPSPAWQTCLRALTTEQARYILGRFARYCTAQGIEPVQVDQAVLTTFLDDLTTRSLASEPARTHRDTIVHWNRAAASVPDWPRTALPLPDNRKHYAQPWEVFPASLKQDFDAWLHWLSSPDLTLDRDFIPLRPTSIATRIRQMRGYFGALVAQGEDPAGLVNLAATITPERAAKGLSGILQRTGDKPSVHAAQVAGVLLAIARHWAKADSKHVAALQRMAKRVTPPATGMTAKNRVRLRAVGEAGRLAALLMLPARIQADVLRYGPPTVTQAQRLQTAVAIEILIQAPMRLKNLTGLQIGVHVLRGRDGTVTLSIPEAEVKNGTPFEMPLPEESAKLVALYLASYRPLLALPGSPFLFPGRSADRSKTAEGLRDQIQKCIATSCGLQFNPHTFRHLSGQILLQDNPAAHAVVQRLLGHKSIHTTLNFYTGMETAAAQAHYHELIAQHRNGPPTPGKGGR